MSPSSTLVRKSVTHEELTAIFVRYLAENNYRAAAKVAWPWFKQNQWSDLIWDTIEKHDRLCIMGHGSASKTFTASIWFLLDWISYAETTALALTSSTITSMDRRIWADFKTLWTKSRVDFSSIAAILDGKRLIRQNIHEGKAAVHAIAAESDDSSTKIQGMHMPRNRVIIDEADNPYSNSIWGALTNLGTSGHLKAIALANPTDKNSEFGYHCEPINGWDQIDPEHDFQWESKKGWHVLRLDGLESPNIRAGKDIFPFLLSNKSVDETRDNKGTESPEWWTMIRGFYPPEGIVNTIFPGGLIARCDKPIEWYGQTTPIAFCDPAFEGGDACSLTLAKKGRLANAPNRVGIEIERQIRIKRKDVGKPLGFDYADQIVGHLLNHKVQPKFFGIDTTGTQGPFADIIESIFGKGIIRVGFSEKPSKRRVTNEDTGSARERYKTFVTELWYVAREWCRLGLVYVKASRELKIQLESRRYELKGKDPESGREVIMAEPKTEMKSRGLGSPDEADSFCGVIHVARIHESGFVPGSFEDLVSIKKKKLHRNQTIFRQTYGVEDKG